MVYIDDNAATQDQLSRADFARGLANLIIDAPIGSSFRLGVYGGWGEGKTSVMNMMDSHLRSNGVICAALVPWTTKTPDELLEDLLFTIVDALKLEVGDSLRKREERQTLFQSVAKTVEQVKEVHLFAKIGSALINKAVDHSAGRLAEWKDKNLDAAVRVALANQRVVIFVDDLDRVQPNLLPDLLLNLRSALDLPNLFYVLALSPQIVQQGLAEVHPGWGDSIKFLEKIVEYPAFLPPPSDVEIQHFITATTELLKDVLDAATLKSISALLPRNPRQIKLYLRFMASLKQQLQRFDTDEVSLYSLYVCQMLRLEFPIEVQKLVTEQNALLDIGRNGFGLLQRMRQSQNQSNSTDELPELKCAPSEEPDKTRYLELCDALRKHARHDSMYSLADYCVLLERPPVVTMHEFRELLAMFNALPDGERVSMLQSKLSSLGGGEPSLAVSSALLNIAIRMRRNAYHTLIDADTKKQQTKLIPEVMAYGEFIEFLLSEVGLIKRGLMDADTWANLFELVKQYASWLRPKKLYAPMREQEFRILTAATTSMPDELLFQVYHRIAHAARSRSDRYVRQPELSPEMIKRLISIRTNAEQTIVGVIIRSFRTPQGILSMFDRNDETNAARRLVFDPASQFYSRQNLKAIDLLVNEAKGDVVVHQSFLDLFMIIAYGLKHNNYSIHFDQLRNKADDDKLLRRFWDGSVAQALNPRTVGSLNVMINEFNNQFGVDPSMFKKPHWYLRMEQEMSPPQQNMDAESSSG